MYMNSMSFCLGADVDALRETVQRFSQTEIAPLAEATDRDNAFPMHVIFQNGFSDAFINKAWNIICQNKICF